MDKKTSNYHIILDNATSIDLPSEFARTIVVIDVAKTNYTDNKFYSNTFIFIH
ncbi:MAG: hypothetical protein ACPKQO_01810 [Nitrososphaeraceae archaeon]